MTAMTPIQCFRVKGLELWAEDYAGNRTLIATCPNKEQHEWLVSSMVVFHRSNVYDWDGQLRK